MNRYFVRIMNTLIRAGLIFLIGGGLSFLALIFVALFSVGATGNPSLTAWWVPLIRFIYTMAVFCFAYLVIGAVRLSRPHHHECYNKQDDEEAEIMGKKM
jgi:phosphotransferase system  glucose/maltose/N-acetylglucosamine-specific IIC component